MQKMSIPSYKAIPAIAWRRFRERMWALLLAAFIMFAIEVAARAAFSGSENVLLRNDLLRNVLRRLILFPLNVGFAAFSLDYLKMREINYATLFNYYRKSVLLKSCMLGLFVVLPDMALTAAVRRLLAGIHYYGASGMLTYLLSFIAFIPSFVWHLFVFFSTYLLIIEPERRVGDIIITGLRLGVKNIIKILLFRLLSYIPGLLFSLLFMLMTFLPFRAFAGSVLSSPLAYYIQMFVTLVIFAPWINLCCAAFAAKALNGTDISPRAEPAP